MWKVSKYNSWLLNIFSIGFVLGPGSLQNFMLKFMLFHINVQTWLLRSHVRQPLFTHMEFNTIFLISPGPWIIFRRVSCGTCISIVWKSPSRPLDLYIYVSRFVVISCDESLAIRYSNILQSKCHLCSLSRDIESTQNTAGALLPWSKIT